jgi:hypothetical protein
MRMEETATLAAGTIAGTSVAMIVATLAAGAAVAAVATVDASRAVADKSRSPAKVGLAVPTFCGTAVFLPTIAARPNLRKGVSLPDA